jgi:hypothetical protein
VTLHGSQAGPFEDVDMFRDGRKRHVESRRKLAYRAIAPDEPRKDLAPSRIGERGKGRIQIRWIVNHVV